jgi:type II secretory pathway pseudopilin PulG
MQRFKTAFTLVELVFIIIILGILAVVAIPKLLGVKEAADESVVKGFVGTLNRTVVAAKWNGSIMDGDEGSKDTDTTTYNITEIDTEFPPLFSATTISTEDCLDDSVDTSVANNSGVVLSASDGKFHIICRDGNASTPPKFWYKEGAATLAVEINGTAPKAEAP